MVRRKRRATAPARVAASSWPSSSLRATVLQGGPILLPLWPVVCQTLCYPSEVKTWPTSVLLLLAPALALPATLEVSFIDAGAKPVEDAAAWAVPKGGAAAL